MGKKRKKRKNGGPKRKRMNRKSRLPHVRDTQWIENYEGKNIVRSYSKWFGVDLLCAVTELELLGRKVSDKRKRQVYQAMEQRRKENKKRKRRKQQKQHEDEMFDGDAPFYYIAGYTSNGVPFGITHEEMEEIDPEKQTNDSQNQNVDPFDDDFPF